MGDSFHLFLTEELAGGAGNTSNSQGGIPFDKNRTPVNEEMPWRDADGTHLPKYGETAGFLDKYAIKCSVEARSQYPNISGYMFWCGSCWSEAKRAVSVLRSLHATSKVPATNSAAVCNYT